jgi:hypothetical protein
MHCCRESFLLLKRMVISPSADTFTGIPPQRNAEWAAVERAPEYEPTSGWVSIMLPDAWTKSPSKMACSLPSGAQAAVRRRRISSGSPSLCLWLRGEDQDPSRSRRMAIGRDPGWAYVDPVCWKLAAAVQDSLLDLPRGNPLVRALD